MMRRRRGLRRRGYGDNGLRTACGRDAIEEHDDFGQLGHRDHLGRPEHAEQREWEEHNDNRKARPMLPVMIRRPRLAWASACGIRRRSIPVKATSADSTAAAEPVAPIAMPTLAAASAGGSLMPA